MGLPKYIVNIDELGRALENTAPEISLGDGGLSELLEDYLGRIQSLLGTVFADGTQRSVGLQKHIPALMSDFELTHVFDTDVYLTGITYSQTGWKPRDRWSLYAGDALLFDGVYTKELGEYKHFNVFRSVPPGTEVRLVYHNNSGNSKQVWFDIAYLQRDAAPPPDIPPGRDWVITVSWRGGRDIDCCWADADNGEVLMGCSTAALGEPPDRIYKDRDDTGADGAETWSLEGRYRDRLLFGLGWYSEQGPHDADITITLYDADGHIVDIRRDISGAALGVCGDKSGEFLCVYEFDLTKQNHAEQWKRVDTVIRS